jgi:HEAT repeat protein
MQIILRAAAVIILGSLLLKCAFSQDSPTGQFSPSMGHFESWKQTLQNRKIQLTEESLLAALRNPDPDIRSLAALVLAEDKAGEAVGAIEHAAAHEKARETQIDMALALALLSDNQGVRMLQQACDDPGTPANLRMYAAKYILDTKNKGCLSVVENFLLSAPDSGSRRLAFSEIVRFQHVSDADAHKIFAALVTSLGDPEPQIRMGASGALAELGNQSAVPELQKAIAAESGDAVRSSMQSDLRKLREKVP